MVSRMGTTWLIIYEPVGGSDLPEILLEKLEKINPNVVYDEREIIGFSVDVAEIEQTINKIREQGRQVEEDGKIYYIVEDEDGLERKISEDELISLEYFVQRVKKVLKPKFGDDIDIVDITVE